MDLSKNSTMRTNIFLQVYSSVSTKVAPARRGFTLDGPRINAIWQLRYGPEEGVRDMLKHYLFST